MAFKDENGKITIDEAAAQSDIRNISAAIEGLKEARASLVEIKYQAASFSGKTSAGITEASEQLVNKYDALISQLEETRGRISAAVSKYQQIDANLRDLMNGGE